MIIKIRKKPVTVDAMHLSDSADQTHDEILAWIRSHGVEALRVRPDGIVIPTLEGDMTANVGDWIIRGVKGEFYPCKPDIIAATYDIIKETP